MKKYYGDYNRAYNSFKTMDIDRLISLSRFKEILTENAITALRDVIKEKNGKNS